MSTTEEVRARKLQPIYNALESGNWRQAVRLCEKRDVEKWLTTKALRANGLWRLGKYDEALRLCLEVQGASPTDEDTLAAMSYNYRMMNRRENVGPMFEAAVKAKPGDPALLKELFMSYVRSKQYLKAQQTATKLYKVDAKGGKFIIWAAATMLIQAERKDSTAGPMTLALAEKMTVKVLEEKAANGSRPVGEELRLFLDILKLQGKHREALDALGRFEPTTPAEVVSTAEGGGTIEDESSLEDGTIVNMQELERLELKAELFERLGSAEDLEQAEDIVRGLVRRSADQWSYYVSLLDLVDKRNGLSEAAAGDGGKRDRVWPASLTSALKLIRQLQEENPGWRGPFLAEMEVWKRAIVWFGSDRSLPAEAVAPASGGEKCEEAPGSGSSVPLDAAGENGTLWSLLCRCIARYMETFSAKLCCFRDMKPYLALYAIDPSCKGLTEGLAWLKDFFKEKAADAKAGEDLGKPAEGAPLEQAQRDLGVKRLHRYICACQSRHLLGDYTASYPISDSSIAKSSNGEPAEAVTREAEDVGTTEQRYRDVVRELTTQYRATLHLNLGSEGGQREVQHGDDLVLMAAQTLLRLCSLYDDCATEGDRSAEAKGYLGRVEAACLLEAAISCSPYNHHLKVLAIDVYRDLGSFARGLTLFGELDVKQIQLDTLSYLMLGPSHSHGLFGEIQGQCKNITTVHRNCRNETAEHVARAFDRGNYSKGAEVDRFQREKLDLSLQLALAKAEKVGMDVILDHQTYTSAARFLQEEALSDGGGGAIFPGDEWLQSRMENMDYSVQSDRCLAVSKTTEAATEKRRLLHLKACLKRRLLANQTLLLALKGDPPADVNAKAKELEAAAAAAALASTSCAVGDVDGLAESVADLQMADAESTSNTRAFPWLLLAHASRSLAFAHHGLASGVSGAEDPKALESAAKAMSEGAACAKAYRGLLSSCPRHACATGSGEGGGKVHQAEAPLRPTWLRLVSKALADGGVSTCIILQAIGAELPLDKKKKSGKGKAKGKGKKAASGATGGAGGEVGGPSAAVSKLQQALSAFGWEVAELLRTMSAALKSEISAKMEPLHPGQTMSRLLKGDLGAHYVPAIGVLWEETPRRWCEEGVVRKSVIGVTGGQAISCQRLLSVVAENLSLLQRWDKK